MRILMVLIPDGATADRPILRIERIVEPYYIFRDAAVDVVLASPDGGFPWIGLANEDPTPPPASLLRFRLDCVARDALTDTLRLDQIFPDDFDAALCVGSPGPIGDCGQASTVLAAFLAAGKPVAVMPSEHELVPHGTGDGLLITGDGAATPVRAAHALIGSLRS